MHCFLLKVSKNCQKECSDGYSKTSGSLWKYYRDEPALTDAGGIDNCPDNRALFKVKENITGKTYNNVTKYVETMVSLKYLSDFWRTLEMLSINYEINVILTWSANCFIAARTANNQVPKFETTDTKLYINIVTLSTQDNVKQ